MEDNPLVSCKFSMSLLKLDYVSHELEESPCTRHLKFMRFAHEIFAWFEVEPTLESVQLQAGIFLERGDFPASLSIRHHYVLDTPGVPNLVKDASVFANKSLPYREMGQGTFKVDLDDVEVQAHLALIRDPRQYFDMQDEYLNLVYRLARRIDASFEHSPEIRHDSGVTIASDQS